MDYIEIDKILAMVQIIMAIMNFQVTPYYFVIDYKAEIQDVYPLVGMGIEINVTNLVIEVSVIGDPIEQNDAD